MAGYKDEIDKRLTSEYSEGMSVPNGYDTGLARELGCTSEYVRQRRVAFGVGVDRRSKLNGIVQTLRDGPPSLAWGQQKAEARRLGTSSKLLRIARDLAEVPLIPMNQYHGTLHRYVAGCRCDECRVANNARQRAAVEQRKQHLQDAPHGTDGGYGNWGCRCDLCKHAHSVAMSNRKHRT